MRIVAGLLLTAVILSTVAAIVGTGRITLSLVVSGLAMWSFVPVLQLLTGLVLVGFRRDALERYFATGYIWHLSLLAIGVFFLLWPSPPEFLVAAIIVPFALTARALRSVAPPGRVALHQAITLALLIGYVAWAIGGWARIAGLVRGA